MDEEMQADLEAEEELFGGPPDAEQHEAQVRGMMWGSHAGSEDGSNGGGSEPGDSASQANGAGYYFNPRVRARQNGSHWNAQPHSQRAGSEADGPVQQGNGVAHIPARAECHVRHMPASRSESSTALALLGSGIRMRAPLFAKATQVHTDG